MKNLVIIATILVSFVHAQNHSALKNDTSQVNRLFRAALRYDLIASQRQNLLDSVLLIRRDLPYVWQQKAMPYFKMKKYETGMMYLDSAVKYDNSGKYFEYRAFIRCIFQKHYRAALADFISLERMNLPGYVMDHSYSFYKGVCYLQLTRYDSAIECFSKSINQSISRGVEGHYLEYLYRGIARMENLNFREAEPDFDLALQYYPHFTEAKYYKSVCLRRQGHIAAANQLLNEAVTDFKAGYTINEDNVLYEDYPYQLRKEWLMATQRAMLDNKLPQE